LTRLRQRLRPDKMATGDRGVARRAKTGLPRHSFATAGGFGVVPLGFATDALRGSAGSVTGGDGSFGYLKSFHSGRLW